jgi:hypothetical protein
VPDRETQTELVGNHPRSDARNLRVATPSAETLRDRLVATFEMFELGVNMMAAKLRRRHPQASTEEIERLLDAWLLERPGAEDGDGPGVPVSLERFRSPCEPSHGDATCAPVLLRFALVDG